MLTGTQHLALAILIQAIEDSSEDIYQEDVGIFLDSVWFEMLVEGLEQEPSDFRSKIKNNEISLDGIHAVYRSKDGKRKGRFSRQAQTSLANERSLNSQRSHNKNIKSHSKLSTSFVPPSPSTFPMKGVPNDN